MTAVDDRYARLGGASGPLGAVTKNEAEAATTGWRSATYANGIILARDDDAHAVYGSIFGRYEQEGLEAWALPCSSELYAPKVDARWNWFSTGGAAIVWRPGAGTRKVTGQIAGKWRRIGSMFGVLSAPADEERPLGGGRYQDFLGGSIYTGTTTGTHVVLGAILARWKALGGPSSTLGWPISDEIRAEDRVTRLSRFEHGTITWTAAGGVKVDS